MAGKAVRMKFTLIMQNSVTTNKTFLVLVNGTPVASTESTSVYAGTTTSITRI
jgi:hypothetical protein